MSRLFFAVLLASVLSTPALAGDRHGRDDDDERGRGRRMAQIADEVGLDDKQRAAVEEILFKANLAKVETKAKLEKAKLELKHALAADTLDEKAVKVATDTVATATGDLVRNRVDRIVQIRKQLTAEQWEKLYAMWKGGDDEEEQGE